MLDAIRYGVHVWVSDFGSSMVPTLSILAVVILGVWGAFAFRRLALAIARHMTADLQQREFALASGPNGIVIVDATKPDHPITFVNRQFERMTGYSQAEVVGKNCRFLQGTDRQQKGGEAIRKALREQRDCRVLLRNYRKDGTPFWNDVTITPVRNDMGRIIQYVGVQQDVTEREQSYRRVSTQLATLRALAESASLQEAAQRILQGLCENQDWELGTFWVLDHRDHVLRCQEVWHSEDLDVSDFERFVRQTPFPQEMGLPGVIWSRGEPVWFGDILKDADLPEASLAAKRGLASACGFPIANRQGLQGVLAFYSRTIWPLNKNLLLLMVGTGAQFSQYIERQEKEGHERELAGLERGLAEFMGEGLLAMDREGVCLYANRAVTDHLGYTPQTLLGQNLHEALHPAYAMKPACDDQCPLLLSLQSTQARYVDDGSVFCKQDKTAIPVAYTTSPIIDKGLIRGVVVTFREETQSRGGDAELRRALRQKEDELKQVRNLLDELKHKPHPPSSSDLILQKIRQMLK